MKIASLLFLGLFAFQTQAAVQTRDVPYTDDNVELQGFVAYDDTKPSPQPAILIVHDWMGLSDFTKQRAQLLANQGYVAFAVDVYGKGNKPQNRDEATKKSKEYKDDRALFQKRMKAAYTTLTAMKEVDPRQIIVMGYCFGGTGALELARSGAPLIGTVSFHGGLSNPNPENAKNIKGKVLVLHGEEDPFVPPKEVEAFKEEMQAAKINAKIITYKGAVHAFTDPNVGNDKKSGIAYNAEADKKSWRDFQEFLMETVKTP